MIITDPKTQSEILSEMVKDLTSEMPRDKYEIFIRRHFDNVIVKKHMNSRFPKMNITIVKQ